MSYPIAYAADMPAERNRLTVFFRLLMMIPIAIVGFFYIIGAFFCILIAWFALVFTGRYPDGLYGFVRGVAQFMTRMNGYAYLQTDVYPPFDTGEHPEYPIRLSIPEQPEEQNRMTVIFRLILFIPVYIIQYAFSIAAQLVAIVMWFAALFTGKSPEGLHNALTFLLGYYARSMAYAALLTDKWPPISEEAGLPVGQPSGTLTSPPPPPPPPPAPVGEPAAAAPPPPPPPPPPPSSEPPPPPPPPPSQDEDDRPAGGPF
ncbi:MAG TPA: DUF4389 domain-containing protein [Solirubrobacteraceae bacterium]